MTHKEMLNQTDLLKGSINRICITDDIEELFQMYRSAQYRLNTIFDYSYAILSGLKADDLYDV